MSQKKQGFVHGALILMLAGIVVKIVGALFKIPLSNIIGDTAMGYFNTAYSVYSMCFLISIAHGCVNATAQLDLSGSFLLFPVTALLTVSALRYMHSLLCACRLKNHGLRCILWYH